MELVEYLYNKKKRWTRRLRDFYDAYFTIEGTYTSLLPDKIYIKKLYKKRVGKDLNLKNPTTFNEKLQWIKLYDRRPEYTLMVDKYAVRDYIKEKIERRGLTCSDIGLYFIPLLGVWDKVDDIDFASLPNQFVLKPNHCSDVIICRDKKNNDYQSKKGALKNVEEVKAYLNYRMKQNYYKTCREWPYKNVIRKIICERYMQDNNNESLVDYKFFCFNGKPKYLYITQHINGKEYINYFNENFQPIDVIRDDLDSLCVDCFIKPKTFEKMKEIAHLLSSELYWIRIDLYEINGTVYFGELTLFPTGGFVPYSTEKWNKIFGNMICLPRKRRF